MAVSTTSLNRVLTVTLDRYAKKISNELARLDGVIAVFGKKGRILVTGGKNAVETLDYAENPNFAIRSPYVNVPTAKADTRLQAKWGWACIDGSVTLNDHDEAMNSGESKIYDLVASDVKNAQNTIVRQFANALRKASPGGSDPDSVLSLIEDNAAASQANESGGLSRSTYTWWRNQYSAATMDLSGSNLERLFAFILQDCSKGTSKLDRPDFGLLNGTLYAALAYQAHQYTRWTPDIETAAMGFRNINVDGVVMIPDSSIVAGDLYLINTNYMQLQVLRNGNMKNVGERPQTVPVSVRGFQDAYNSRHRASIMYVDFALTTSSLQRQGIATACS